MARILTPWENWLLKMDPDDYLEVAGPQQCDGGPCGDDPDCPCQQQEESE